MTDVAIETHEASCMLEYLRLAHEILAAWKSAFAESEAWFRGQSAASHKLVPGAYRQRWDENSMFNRFVTEAPLLIEPGYRPTEPWEWYFAAQHYGLPTRLLDWSDDPLVGLFFAVRGMANDTDDLATKWKSGDPPVVWMLEAGSLNHCFYRRDLVYLAGGTAIRTDLWLPDAVDMGASQPLDPEDAAGHHNNFPIAIHPARLTRRIQAQSGKFTVHGTSRDPIEDLWLANAAEDRRAHLVRIVVTDPARVTRQLFDTAYTRMRLFPEPQSLADHLRRIYAPEREDA